MKLCRLNLPKDNNLFNNVEPESHYQNRIHILVPDDYDFNNNNDVDESGNCVAWEAHYRRLKINYVHFLKIIQGILIPKANPNYPALDYTGWGNLTEEEKKIAIRYHAAPYSLRIGVESYQVTDEKDKINWQNLLSESKEGRVSIIEEMRTQTGEYLRTGVLTMSNSQSLFRDVEDMIRYYQNTNDPEFKVWICSIDDTAVSGYNYYNNGFKSKSYWTQEIEDLLLRIYSGQNYV